MQIFCNALLEFELLLYSYSVETTKTRSIHKDELWILATSIVAQLIFTSSLKLIIIIIRSPIILIVLE